MKRHTLFQGDMIINYLSKSSMLRPKLSLVKGIQGCSKEAPHPFSRGDNNEIEKVHWRTLKIYSSWTKIRLKHCIQVCSNIRLYVFSRGEKNEIAKMHWRNLKILFQNHLANFFQTRHKVSYDEEGSTWNEKEPFNSKKVIMSFFSFD